MGNKDVDEWYEKFSERLYSNLSRSNFHQELQEVYLDLGAFGTGCVLMDEKKTPGPMFGGFRFQAQEVGTYAISEDGEGYVDVVFRILKMSPRAAIKRWGAGKVGPNITKRAADPAQADMMMDILHGVYPREGKSGYRRGTPSKSLPVASCYIDIEAAYEIEESGFHEMPMFVPRWSKVSGETYGRGPGFTALGDISTMDEATKLNLQAWQFAIRPALLRRHDGVIGSPKIMPNGFIDVYDMEALKPLESGQNVQINQIESERLLNDIRNAFFWEQLQLPNQAIYTATEINRRLELMQRVLGPTLGRLEVELHSRLIGRGAQMMLRAGEKSGWQDPLGAPEPPQEILQAMAQGIADADIQYIGPLARAQKSGDVDNLVAGLQAVLPIVQMQPDTAQTLNGEECIRFVFDRRGLPANLTRSEEEVQQINDALAQQRQQQQQQEQLLNAATAAQKVAPVMGQMQQSGMADQMEQNGQGNPMMSAMGMPEEATAQ